MFKYKAPKLSEYVSHITEMQYQLKRLIFSLAMIKLDDVRNEHRHMKLNGITINQKTLKTLFHEMFI